MTPSSTENAKERGQGAEIIQHSGAQRQSDPLLEELNVVKLEGRYFCFDLREVPKRKGLLDYRDGDRGLKIELHPEYGQPSILAYRVLQATFRKITLEGRPFPDNVAFSFRELSRIIGRDVWGGKDGQEIIRAINQLQRTMITLSLDSPEKKEKRWVQFNLVVTSGFVSSGDNAAPSRIKSAVLTIHPVIIDSMRRGHFVIFNWERINSLAPLSAALYKRLYLHLSNLFETKHTKTSLKFEKDYEDICGEWLGGLQPFPFKSRIEQQLAPHLDALKQCGLIRSWAVEKKADRKKYKLVFTPGAGFFLDYDLFYHGSTARVLQFQRAADEAKIHAPMELTRYFFQRLHNAEKVDPGIFSEKDVEFAETLLRRYGMDEGRAFLDFVLASAASTKFQIKSIRAAKTYLPSWEANRDVREKHVAQERARAQKEQAEKLKSGYDSFIRKQAYDHLQALSPEERAALKAQAEQNAAERYGMHAPGFSLSVTFEERKLTIQQFPPPSFEEWQKTLR